MNVAVPLWTSALYSTPSIINVAVPKMIKMSELKLRPFEEQLADVIYTNRLEQAEEKGMKKGMKKGEENIIRKLLEKNNPQEISHN